MLFDTTTCETSAVFTVDRKKGLCDKKSVHLKLEIEPGLHYFLFIIWDLERSSKDMNQEAKLKQVISTHLRDKGQQAYEKSNEELNEAKVIENCGRR